VLALLPGHARLCGVLLALPPLLLPGARDDFGLKRVAPCWCDDGDSSSSDCSKTHDSSTPQRRQAVGYCCLSNIHMQPEIQGQGCKEVKLPEG
jgi:hypothetical protein